MNYFTRFWLKKKIENTDNWTKNIEIKIDMKSILHSNLKYHIVRYHTHRWVGELPKVLYTPSLLACRRSKRSRTYFHRHYINGFFYVQTNNLVVIYCRNYLLFYSNITFTLYFTKNYKRFYKYNGSTNKVKNSAERHSEIWKTLFLELILF